MKLDDIKVGTKVIFEFEVVDSIKDALYPYFGEFFRLKEIDGNGYISAYREELVNGKIYLRN